MNSDGFKEGDYVINPKALDWGIGIVVTDQIGERVSVFFENEGNTKTIIQSYVALEEVSEPGDAKLYLDNIIKDDRTDRHPFSTILQKYVEDFPGGFYGEKFLEGERNYKVAAHEWVLEHLSEDKMRSLISDRKYAELAEDIKRAYAKTNLLASFEMIKLSDAFKLEEAQKTISEALFELLYGDKPFNVRFKATAKILGRYDLDKWPIITYLLFLRFPKQYMFVKPTATKAAAANRSFDIRYESALNTNTYSYIQLFAQDLFKGLSRKDNKELAPRDMIDVQSFMWCTYSTY